MILNDRLLNAKELAGYFGVSRGTIVNWKKRGMPFLKICTNVRYDLTAVMKWVKEQQLCENRGTKK